VLFRSVEASCLVSKKRKPTMHKLFALLFSVLLVNAQLQNQPSQFQNQPSSMQQGGVGQQQSRQLDLSRIAGQQRGMQGENDEEGRFWIKATGTACIEAKHMDVVLDLLWDENTLKGQTQQQPITGQQQPGVGQQQPAGQQQQQVQGQQPVAGQQQPVVQQMGGQQGKAGILQNQAYQKLQTLMQFLSSYQGVTRVRLVNLLLVPSNLIKEGGQQQTPAGQAPAQKAPAQQPVTPQQQQQQQTTTPVVQGQNVDYTILYQIAFRCLANNLGSIIDQTQQYGVTRISSQNLVADDQDLFQARSLAIQNAAQFIMQHAQSTLQALNVNTNQALISGLTIDGQVLQPEFGFFPLISELLSFLGNIKLGWVTSPVIQMQEYLSEEKGVSSKQGQQQQAGATGTNVGSLNVGAWNLPHMLHNMQEISTNVGILISISPVAFGQVVQKFGQGFQQQQGLISGGQFGQQQGQFGGQLGQGGFQQGGQRQQGVSQVGQQQQPVMGQQGFQGQQQGTTPFGTPTTQQQS